MGLTWTSVVRAYERFHKFTKPLNESKLLAGILIVMINISSKFVDIRLSQPMEAYFRHTFSRHLLVFAVAWMPTRDVVLAAVISLLTIFVVDHLTNIRSPWCALSEQFTGTHLSLAAQKEREDQEKRDQEKKAKASADGASAVPPTARLTRDDIDRAIWALEHLRDATVAGTINSRSTPTAATTAAPAPTPTPHSGTSFSAYSAL